MTLQERRTNLVRAHDQFLDERGGSLTGYITYYTGPGEQKTIENATALYHADLELRNKAAALAGTNKRPTF